MMHKNKIGVDVTRTPTLNINFFNNTSQYNITNKRTPATGMVERSNTKLSQALNQQLTLQIHIHNQSSPKKNYCG